MYKIRNLLCPIYVYIQYIYKLTTAVFQNALHDNNRSQQQQQPSPPLNPPAQGLKKKKRPNDAPATLDVSDDAVSLKPQLHNHSNKAKHVWKKHVWVLLLLDLFVCAVLFVIWLWVCSGFKCMAY